MEASPVRSRAGVAPQDLHAFWGFCSLEKSVSGKGNGTRNGGTDYLLTHARLGYQYLRLYGLPEIPGRLLRGPEGNREEVLPPIYPGKGWCGIGWMVRGCGQGPDQCSRRLGDQAGKAAPTQRHGNGLFRVHGLFRPGWVPGGAEPVFPEDDGLQGSPCGYGGD